MFAHHLEVGPFPSEFTFSSVPDHFLKADEELGISREVVNLFKSNTAYFTFVVFQVEDDGDYPFGIDEPPKNIGFCIIPIL